LHNHVEFHHAESHHGLFRLHIIYMCVTVEELYNMQKQTAISDINESQNMQLKCKENGEDWQIKMYVLLYFISMY